MVKVPEPRNALAASQRGGGASSLAPREQRRTAPLQTALASPDAFGASAARGLEQLGQGLGVAGDVAYAAQQRDQQERTEIEVKEREIGLRRQLRELENEYLATGQKSTVDGWADYSRRVEAIRNRAGEGMQSEEGRRLISLAAAQLGESALDRGQRHQLNERTAYRTTLSQTRLEEARQDVSARPGDPAVLSQARRTARTEAAEQARIRGLDPESADFLARTQVSRVTVAAVEARLEEDPLAARQMLSRGDIGGSILPDELPKLRERVQARVNEFQFDEAVLFDTRDQFSAALEPGPAVTPEAGEAKLGRPGYVYGRLSEAGIAPHLAAGVIGALTGESGKTLDPGLNERAPVVPGSRGGWGIAQWTGPRRKAFEAFAAERGAPVDDLDTQIDFLLQEFQGSEAAAWAQVQQAETPEDAARLFTKAFLRPGIPNTARRIDAATAFAEKIGDAGVADPRFAGMRPEVREKAMAVLDRKARARLAEREKEITDISIGIRAGVLDPSEAPSRESLVEDFGAELGGAVADQLDDAAVFGGAVRTISSGTLSQAREAVEAAQAKAQDADDFEQDAREAEALRSAYVDMIERVTADPGGVAGEGDALIADLRSGISKTSPADVAPMVKALMRKTLAAQEAREIPGGAMRPLAVQDARALAATLEAVPPEQMSTVLTNWRTELGGDFDMVLDQLIRDGKLDGDIVPMAVFSDSQVAMRFLERMRGVDDDQVREDLKRRDIAVADIDLAIGEQLGDFLAAMGADDPDGERFQAGLDIASMLGRAARLEVSKRMDGDIDEAVSKVIKNTIEEGYTLMVRDGGHKVIAPSHVKLETLEAASSAFIRNFDASELFTSGGDPVDDAVMAHFLARDAFFVTRGDAGGVVLTVEVNGEDVPLYDKNGQPVGFDFSEVRGIAERARPVYGGRRVQPKPDPAGVTGLDVGAELVRDGLEYYQENLEPSDIGGAILDALAPPEGPRSRSTAGQMGRARRRNTEQ